MIFAVIGLGYFSTVVEIVGDFELTAERAAETVESLEADVDECFWVVDEILAQNVGLVIGGSIDVMLAVGVLNWAMGTLYGLKRVSSVF